MSDITIMQALNKTVIATKNYIDKAVTIVDTDLQQVIYDIYGYSIDYSEATQTISIEESFISYDEPTKTLNIKGLEL